MSGPWDREAQPEDDPGIEWPEFPPRLGFETADAQHIVAALDRVTEQLRIGNLLALGQYRVAPDDLPPFRQFVMEPVGTYEVRPVEEIRKGLGL